MDAATFRWVLIVIAVLLVLVIYFYGQHQSKLRQRNSIDSVTRDEIDSAFVEDEQLRSELDNLDQVLSDNEIDDDLGDMEINPSRDTQSTPFTLPDLEIFEHDEITRCNPDRLISYHLRYDDFRLVTGEEAEAARQQLGLQLDATGLLEYYENGLLAFRVASLTSPGDFSEVESLEFSTLGFNCFIDLERSEDARAAYEVLLKKVDELVRLLNLKVYKSENELLTLSDVTSARNKLLG